MQVALGRYIGPWRGCHCWARMCNNTVKGWYYFPIPTLADPSAAPAFAATNEYVLQSRADFYAHAKSRWWLWRGSRSNVTLRRIICSDTEPRYGWWKGSLGYDWPTGTASSVPYRTIIRTNIFLYRWKWLGELKQDDGGFIMSVEGEEDVRFVSRSFQGSRRYSSFGRGAYSAMLMISLLALPLELPPHAPSRSNGFNLFSDGLPEYLSRCAYHTLLCIALKLN